MKTLFYCGVHNLVNFSRVRPYYDLCYGFDANPDKVEHARKVYQNDPDVKIIHGALTEKGGEEVEFTITTDWDPASSMGNPNPQFGHMISGLLTAQKRIKVPTINLYDFCKSINIQEIDTLITDLQGMDLAVLQTLKEFIQQRKIREIQCEVEPDNTPPRYLEIPTSKFSEFMQLLSDKYDVLWVDPVNLQQAEGAWEMNVRWRVKGGQPSDDVEFIMENELLVAKVGANSSLATHSQYREDLVIDALFSHRRQGFYVDVGANDPDVFSNTKLLYNKGWQGINIEPESNLCTKLCTKRDRDINLNVGAGPEPGLMTFYRMSADTLSSFNKEAAIQGGKLYGATLVSEEQIPIMKLADILEENLKGMAIDFLSVDALGYDLAVLKSNDWTRYQPSVIIVEINVGGEEIIQFLQEHDYLLIFNNHTNGIFVSRKFFNTIDDCVRKDLARLEQKYNLETFSPCSAGRDNLVVNFVYGHMRQEDNRAVHSGSISIIWSTLPIEGCDVYVYHNAFSYKGKKGGIDFLLMLEPVVVLPGEFDQRVWKHFDHIFGLFDALKAHGDKFHKILFPRADISGKNPVTAIQSQRELLYQLSGRKNAICMISGNKSSHVPGELYSKRVEVAQWFAEHSKIPFDIYGKPPFALPNYRGEIPAGEKLSVMKQYRYSLCFENTSHPVLSAGYITEKILDCLETRTIPIYLGASNIEQYIPPECFIDFRKFADFRELDMYLNSISATKYKEYITAIDAFVCSGGLGKYSESALYNDIVKVLIDEKSLDAKYFSNDLDWKTGLSPASRKTEWKTSNGPTMWTWNHLSKADSPLLSPSEINSAEKDIGSEIVKNGSKDSKLLRLSKMKTIKVLYAGKKYSNGNAMRGYDYGWWNLYDALCRFENVQVQFFDYVTEAQQRGVSGMSDRLLEIVRKEQFDLFLYRPFALYADILPEEMQSIADHTDTQTVIWMNDDDHSFDYNACLWAPCVDYIVTTSHEAVSKYQEAGFGNKIIKSQWAFNPFKYRSTPLARTRDVSFVGSAQGNRTELIEKMRQSGLSVDVFGSGWHEDSFIPFYDMANIFSQSRINLNLSNSNTIKVQQIRRRNFEVTGCGGFLITTPEENLEDYYEPDKEVVIATSPEELIDKSKYYLVHESERENIGRRGYERTIAEHTWTNRFVDIFKHIGFKTVALHLPQIPLLPFLQSAEAIIAGGAHHADLVLPSTEQGDGESIEATISVMAYNQLKYTRQCVESILHYTTNTYELLLIDNGSTDGTFEYFEWVKSFHHNTRVIRNFRNRIVEATANHTVSIARGKYIVGATNDTMVHEGWLENFINQIESAPDLGMVGPRSNNISGPQAMPAEYDTTEAYQTFAAQCCKQHRGENFPIERLVGMCAIMKKDVLNRIGGWDPDLPTNGRDGGYGFSDDDFSLRFRLAGYKSLVANDVFIHHFGSMTARQYRPDLFGAPQNINKEKYLKKLQRNDRISIGSRGELTLKPYGLNDHISVAENTVIRSPQICIVESGSGVGEATGRPISYAALADSYHGKVISTGSDSIQHLLTKTITSGEYDFVVLVDIRIAPSVEKIKAIIETALCYPDVAIMVPIGNFAPSTHDVHRKANGKIVEIIKYADLSFCVINIKLIRPFTQGLLQSKNDDDFFWFLQRRVRGEGYFIAKANNIIADADVPSDGHPYDSHPLPEQWVQEKKYEEATAVYKDDLSKDPAFVESLYQLAYIAKVRHQSSEAIQYAQDALQIDPHHIQSLIFLSRIFLEQGNLKSAETVVRLSNFKQPGNPEVQKMVEMYEAQLKGEAGIFQAVAVKEIPALIHSEFTEGLTSIIIPVQSIHLDECILSIKKYTDKPYEIIFLDHGVAPKLKKQILKAIKENRNYKVVKIDRRVNFTQSLNAGINQSTGEYIMILFDDVFVGEGWLADMLECLQAARKIGIVGAMSNDASGLQRVEGIDFSSAEKRLSFRERNRHRRIYTRNLDGFCLLFKRDLLRQISLFDEIFGADKNVFDDFCVRAVLEGFNNVIAGNVFVHNRGGINRLLSRDKNLFDEKWIGLDAATPLAEKVLIANAMELASSQYHKGDIVDAVKTLIARIGYSPNERLLFYKIAEILLAENKFQEALDALKGMIPAEDDAEYYALVGYGNEGLGLHKVADDYVEKALAIDSKSALALNLKGILVYKKDEANNAEEYFRRAIDADPGFGEPYTNIGMLKWKEEQKEEAVDLFEKGFIHSPDKGDLVTAYYNAISALELYSRAENIFREARTAYPENKRILFLLIDIFLKQEKFPEAMKEVEKAMVQFGMDTGILSAALEIRRKIGAKTIAVEGGKAKAVPTLSVCMIVKNEEKHLAYCLNSLSPVADELIVVDTGSTDRPRILPRLLVRKYMILNGQTILLWPGTIPCLKLRVTGSW